MYLNREICFKSPMNFLYCGGDELTKSLTYEYQKIEGDLAYYRKYVNFLSKRVFFCKKIGVVTPKN